MQNKPICAILLVVLSCIVACKTIEYPYYKPYTYKTKVIVKGTYTPTESKYLQDILVKQIDDSLQASKIKKTGNKLFSKFKTTYHVLDTNGISRTKSFFEAAYITNGYFRSLLTTYTINNIKNKRDTFRRQVTFIASPNQNNKLDSIHYTIKDSALALLTTQIENNSALRKGEFYAEAQLDLERKRLSDYYRNNGYLKFTKDLIVIEADTINPASLEFTLDDQEKIGILQRQAIFNENPNTDINIKLADTIRPAFLKKYYIGNIYIHPDNINDDITPPNKEMLPNGIVKYYFKDTYSDKLFAPNIFLKKGNLFSQDALNKTINALNYLGPWQQVITSTLDSAMRGDTIDFKISMLPYPKFFSDRRLEGSYNQNVGNNAASSLIKNLYGINVFQLINNRNFSHEGIQNNITANGSIEFGNGKVINTLQAGISYGFNIPRFVFKKLDSLFKNAEQKKSYVSSAVSYTQRINYVQLFDVVLGSGVQWQQANKRNPTSKRNYMLSIPNIEYVDLTKLSGLLEDITRNPLLALNYRSGLITSVRFNVDGSNIKKEKPLISKKNTVQNRLGIEVSYLPKGAFKFIDETLFSFVKLDLEKNFNFERLKHWIAIRTFLGLGLTPFNNSLVQNTHLPFFRQYVGGGPNSMRAWGIRGISSYSTRSGSTQTDFFGDIQAEVNAEYRFKYGKVLVPLNGAFFIDAGNIWNLTPKDKNQVPYNLSSMQRIINDVGIAAGTGFRFDISGYFIIRLDLAMKIKEPQTIEGKGGWFVRDNFTLRFNDMKALKIQLGINYPF